MASLYKRQAGTYGAQFYSSNRSPERKRFSLRTRRKREAKRILRKLETDWRLGRFDPWHDDPFAYDRERTKPSTLKEAKEDFLASRQARGCRPDTVRTYGEVVKLLVGEASAGRPLARVKPSEVRAVVQAEDIAQATRHKRFGHLRTFFRWCVRESLLRESPLDAVVKPKKPEKLPKAVTRSELAAICAAVQKMYEAGRRMNQVEEGEMIWHISLFRFAFYTGMRRSELARLRWRDVNFEKGLVYIWVQKSGKEETIPLSQKAKDILEEVGEGKPDTYVFQAPSGNERKRNARYFGERASKAFRKARDEAGVESGVTFHGLRHGFCTALAEAGKSAIVIKEAARHADISTSMRYVHMARHQLRAELDDVFE